MNIEKLRQRLLPTKREMLNEEIKSFEINFFKLTQEIPTVDSIRLLKSLTAQLNQTLESRRAEIIEELGAINEYFDEL